MSIVLNNSRRIWRLVGCCYFGGKIHLFQIRLNITTFICMNQSQAKNVAAAVAVAVAAVVVVVVGVVVGVVVVVGVASVRLIERSKGFKVNISWMIS